jgi:hypothetical protein
MGLQVTDKYHEHIPERVININGTILGQGTGPDTDTIPSRIESLPNLYTLPLEDGLKESLKHVRQKYIRKLIKKSVHSIGCYIVKNPHIFGQKMVLLIRVRVFKHSSVNATQIKVKYIFHAAVMLSL